MAEKKIIAVVGATGAQGGGLVRAILHDTSGGFKARAITRDVRGPFNIAAEPVLDPDELGRLLHARPVPVPERALRVAVQASWKLRLQPSPPGWLDMALGVPLMDASRAHAELGWTATRSAGDALLELLDGMRRADGIQTPPLAPGGDGFLRLRELLTGVGGRSR